MKNRIKITGYKSFGKKQFAVVVRSKKVSVYNLFGFGLWIYEKGAM